MTNRSQRVATEGRTSNIKYSSVGSPQGCVWSPLLLSIYVQETPSPAFGNYHLIKYADDTILVELCHHNTPSTLDAAANQLADWFTSNHLLLNISKTKELLVSNNRHNPVCQYLTINNTEVEQVETFVYLGTTLDNKLNFSAHAEAILKKARKRLFIMKLLTALRVPKFIRIRCYKSFIECIFLYHLCTVFGHLRKAHN
jgi:hypothetical protein